MARGRMLSTDVSSDPDAQSLSIASYALYLSTIPHLDRDGLIDAHPLKLVAIAAPMRYEFRDTAAALINEWVEIGLVVRYQVSTRQSVLFFKGFRRHQQGMEYKRESASRFPPPPGWTRTEEGLVPDDPELCFRIADYFHVKSDYRKMLIAAAAGDLPDELSEPSRRDREGSRSSRDDFAPNRTEQNSMNGGGGVQDTHHTQPSYGIGGDPRGGAPTRLVSALAELSDDDLRMAADGIGSTLGFNAEYNGWTRMLAGATRAELLLICAWCWKWNRQSPEEMTSVRSYPALLASKLKSGAFPDGMTSWQIHEIRDQVEEAARLMSIPMEEL